MANSVTNTYLKETTWLKQFYRDYVQHSGYLPYMGPSPESIFRIINELKSGGSTVVIPISGRTRGAAVPAGTTLRGSETPFAQFADRIIVDMFSKAISFDKSQLFSTKLDMFNAARKALKDWDAENLRNAISDALASIITTSAADANGFTIDTAVRFADSSAGQRNTHLTVNSDRILLGNRSSVTKAAATTSGTINWTNALAGLTAADDKMTAATLHTAKEMALQTGLTSGFGISPYSHDDDSGESTFIYFAPPEQFRDLANDAEVKYNYAHAAELGMKNPLFRSGDRMLDGIVIRRQVDLAPVGTVGASSALVSRGYLCGQSAVGIAYGQDPTMLTDSYSYDQIKGVGIEEVRGVKKLSAGGQNIGVCEVLTTSTPIGF